MFSYFMGTATSAQTEVPSNDKNILNTTAITPNRLLATSLVSPVLMNRKFSVNNGLEAALERSEILHEQIGVLTEKASDAYAKIDKYETENKLLLEKITTLEITLMNNANDNQSHFNDFRKQKDMVIKLQKQLDYLQNVQKNMIDKKIYEEEVSQRQIIEKKYETLQRNSISKEEHEKTIKKYKHVEQELQTLQSGVISKREHESQIQALQKQLKSSQESSNSDFGGDKYDYNKELTRRIELEKEVEDLKLKRNNGFKREYETELAIRKNTEKELQKLKQSLQAKEFELAKANDILRNTKDKEELDVGSFRKGELEKALAKTRAIQAEIAKRKELETELYNIKKLYRHLQEVLQNSEKGGANIEETRKLKDCILQKTREIQKVVHENSELKSTSIDNLSKLNNMKTKNNELLSSRKMLERELKTFKHKYDVLKKQMEIVSEDNAIMKSNSSSALSSNFSSPSKTSIFSSHLNGSSDSFSSIASDDCGFSTRDNGALTKKLEEEVKLKNQIIIKFKEYQKMNSVLMDFNSNYIKQLLAKIEDLKSNEVEWRNKLDILQKNMMIIRSN